MKLNKNAFLLSEALFGFMVICICILLIYGCLFVFASSSKWVIRFEI